MLEKKNIIPDIVVVATENFPFREKNIFEKSIKKLINDNDDVVVYTKHEKGTIFKDTSNKFEVLINPFSFSLARIVRHVDTEAGENKSLRQLLDLLILFNFLVEFILV